MTHLAILLMGLAAVAANAQTVYRCGNAYMHTPCADARIVDAADPRTDEQRTDSMRVAADQRRLADQMERDRLAEQRALRPAAAGRLSAAPARQVVVLEKVYPLKKRRPARKPSTAMVVTVDPDTGARRRY